MCKVVIKANNDIIKLSLFKFFSCTVHQCLFTLVLVSTMFMINPSLKQNSGEGLSPYISAFFPLSNIKYVFLCVHVCVLVVDIEVLNEEMKIKPH